MYLALTIHPNVEVRLFNPTRSRNGVFVRGLEMLLSVARVNRRMHNKSWIADGRIAVVGGRNIGDAYFDAGNPSNFCDLDLLLLGPAVVQAEVIFDRFWNSKAAIPIGFLSQRQQSYELQALRRQLDTLAIGEQAEPYLRRVAESMSDQPMLSGQVHWSKDAQVISDPPEKANAIGQDGWLMNTISPILASATTDIEIISPYFVPGRSGADELAAIAAKGVRVVVLTNSLAATDVAAVHGAYARYRRPLLKSGVELFELKPYDRKSRISLMGSSSASLHTKAFTVDGRIGFIGSMNFDPRSVSLNTEMGVLFTHPDIIRGVKHTFAEESASRKSYRVFLKRHTLSWLDKAAIPPVILDREPKASFGRRIVAILVGLLPIESLL
jgi:putative cardiolipin synthase